MTAAREHQRWLVLALYLVHFILLHWQEHEDPERGVAFQRHSKGWARPGRTALTSRPACLWVEAGGRRVGRGGSRKEEQTQNARLEAKMRPKADSAGSDTGLQACL